MKSSVSGAFIELQTAVLKALPRDLEDKVALSWAHRGEELTSALRAVFIPPWPKLNEVFSLTLDGDAPENNFAQMMRAGGFVTDVKRGEHARPRVVGTQSRRFKLVCIGTQSGFVVLRDELEKRGRIPEGQWREALRRKFVEPPGLSVGIADPSWIFSGEESAFPGISPEGAPRFFMAEGWFNNSWLWLVECR